MIIVRVGLMTIMVFGLESGRHIQNRSFGLMTIGYTRYALAYLQFSQIQYMYTSNDLLKYNIKLLI